MKSLQFGVLHDLLYELRLLRETIAQEEINVVTALINQLSVGVSLFP
jgi:hypothetical protein